LKLKRFLVSGSFMVTPDYRFPRETFYTTGAGSQLYSLDITGSRREYDLNFGFYVSRSVVLTMGYKGISEKFRVENSRTGTSENKVYLNGVTLGIAGSAPIGKGFSVYGSGAGGWMGVTYDPSSQYTDNGLYEASEMGLAWKAPGRVPLSVSLGYKFQLIQTRINSRNSTNYESLPRNEVTRGPMLGLNLVLLALLARWPARGLAPLEVFGRAPFFFYLAHLWVFGVLSWVFPSGASLGVMFALVPCSTMCSKPSTPFRSVLSPSASVKCRVSLPSPPWIVSALVSSLPMCTLSSPLPPVMLSVSPASP